MASSNPAKTYKDKSIFMVAHFPGEVVTGQIFKNWPEHVTIFPWFEAYESTATDRFLEVIRRIEAFPVDMSPKPLDQLAMYGPEGDQRVRIVGESTSLGVIHGLCMYAFGDFIVDATYSGGVYSPHQSEVPGEYGDLSTILVVDGLCLVAKLLDGRKRIVCAEKFGASNG